LISAGGANGTRRKKRKARPSYKKKGPRDWTSLLYEDEKKGMRVDLTPEEKGAASPIKKQVTSSVLPKVYSHAHTKHVDEGGERRGTGYVPRRSYFCQGTIQREQGLKSSAWK